jgi:hypothetical protein
LTVLLILAFHDNERVVLIVKMLENGKDVKDCFSRRKTDVLNRRVF